MLPLLALGPIPLGASTLPPQRYRRSSRYDFSEQRPVGSAPLRELTGIGDDVLTLDVDIAAGLGSPLAVDLLRSLAASGGSHFLADRSGHIYGRFAVLSVSEQVRRLGRDGGRRRDFVRIELVRTDSGLVDLARGLVGRVAGR